jgi:hypothetical protein
MWDSWWGILKWLAGAGFLAVALAMPAYAQVTIGDNLNLGMSGNLGVGYSGTFGSEGTSHAVFGTGQAQIAGNYYSPNFLNFNIQPFYNRNQDNAEYASVFSETGITATANVFSGSRFPGSVSFAHRNDTGSAYGFLGANGLSSNAVSTDFGINWAALLPNLPSLNASFISSSTSNAIYGLTNTADTSVKILTLTSNYNWDGFQMGGFFSHQNSDVTFPDFLSPTNFETQTNYDVLGFYASHRLPLAGNVSFDYNRTSYSTDGNTYSGSGTTNVFDTTATIAPAHNFTVGGTVRYTTNLLGALQESIVPGGQPVILGGTGQDSNGLTINTYATYTPGHNLSFTGFASTQMQHFLGTDYNSHQFGGSVTYNYARPLFGLLTFSFGMTNNTTAAAASDTSLSSDNGLNFIGTLAFRRIIRHWEVNGDFNYTQSVQSALATFTTSNFTYGGYMRRRFGADWYFAGSYRGIQNGISQVKGYSNRGDTFSAVLTHGIWGVNGSYGTSNGTALETFFGTLQPTPLPPIVSPYYVYFSGTSYGAGLSVSPVSRMIISGNWYRFRSNTISSEIYSRNNNDRIYAQAQYNVRQLSFRAGYFRTYQFISSSAFPGTKVNNYYFNVTRWFNFF